MLRNLKRLQAAVVSFEITLKDNHEKENNLDHHSFDCSFVSRRVCIPDVQEPQP